MCVSCLAINLSELKNRPDVDDLKSRYHFWLLETCQEEKAAEIKETEGDKRSALQLYIKSGLVSRAAKQVYRFFGHGNPKKLPKVTYFLQYDRVLKFKNIDRAAQRIIDNFKTLSIEQNII